MAAGLARAALLGAASVFAANAADAAMMLQMDVNSATVSADGAFSGVNHTGALTFGWTSEVTTLFDILIDDASTGAAPVTASVSGSIQLLNGQVDGGFVSVEVFDAGMMSLGVFTAEIVPGAGQVTEQAFVGFKIDGLLGGGTFDMDTLNGVDVTEWRANEPLDGSFLTFAYNPDAMGVDSAVDLDLWVNVPTPGAVALFGLGGLVALKRRRSNG